MYFIDSHIDSAATRNVMWCLLCSSLWYKAPEEVIRRLFVL